MEPTQNNYDPFKKRTRLEDTLVALVLRDLEPGQRFPIASERMLRVCLRIWAMLHEKNQAYGNSALEPLRVFSRADPVEQIRVRLDDKLSRLARGSAAGEDAVLDLMGYLVLLKVAELDWSDRPLSPAAAAVFLGLKKAEESFSQATSQVVDALTPKEREILRKGGADAWECTRCGAINVPTAARCSGKDCLAWRPTHPELSDKKEGG